MRRHNERSATRTMDYRQVGVRAKTVNEAERSIEALISTETPVMEMDWVRYEVVPRVLLASGAQLPKSRQVPLLDSHNRYSVSSQLGSIRNLTKEEGAVSGVLTFSETAANEWTKVREGHVTDVSVGFRVIEEVYIPEGQTKKIKGRDFTGPMNVATKWRLDEGSITPIGADEAAKMRGLDLANLPNPKKEALNVKPELRQRCIDCGMDKNFTDEQAMEWLNVNATRVLQPAPVPAKGGDGAQASGVAMPTATAAIDVAAIARAAATEAATAVRAEIANETRAAKEQHDAHCRDIDGLCEVAFPGEEGTEGFRRELYSLPKEDARQKILDRQKNQQVAIGSGTRIEFTGSARDNHRNAIHSAFMVRAYDVARNGSAEKLLPTASRAKGWEHFRNMRMIDLARECLMADGYSYRDLAALSPENLARAALGWPEKVGLRSMGYAYHTTGSLAYVTMDAINKSLTTGYGEAPQTWRGPMRQAASVADFKQKHVIKFSAVGNAPIWNDNTVPHEVAFSNEKESYAVEARAETISLSWRLIVNDDMDALSRTPALLGDAMARTVNAVAWAQITSNPVLSDGQALFLETATGNRKRSNLTTGANAPSNTTLGGMKNKMRQMRGLNTPEGNESDDILNIEPRYFVVPSALETVALQLVNSAADPAASGNSGVFNPSRSLTVVIEPRLDATSTTAYYLFADPARIDTAEVTFLQGHETPVTNDYIDEATMSRKVTVIQAFAAKAIDHRGMQRHNGQ